MHSPAPARPAARPPVFAEFLDIGFGRLFRKYDDLVLDALEHLVVHAIVLVHAELTGLDQAVAQHDDGVALAPHALFFLGAVGVGVGHGMAVFAFGLLFLVFWVFVVVFVINRNLRGGVDLLDVLAIDLIGRDVVAAYALVLIAHRGRAVDARADAVEIVLAHEQHRQLPQRRHIERFVEGALVVRGVAEEADRDLVGLLHLDGLGHADRERERAADQRVAAHEMMFDVEDVHGAAAALARSRLFSVELGHHLFGIGAALDGVDVVAVTGDHVVMTRTRRLQHAVAAGLLAGIEMEESTDLALHIGFVAALLKTPREKHLAQQPFLVSGVHENPSLSLKKTVYDKRRTSRRTCCTTGTPSVTPVAETRYDRVFVLSGQAKKRQSGGRSQHESRYKTT